MRAKIEWTIRAAGRYVGDYEVVEIDTPFMQGCLRQGRIVILETIPDEAPAVEKKLWVDPTPNEVPVGEPGAEGLTVPAPKPGPRPRSRASE